VFFTFMDLLKQKYIIWVVMFFASKNVFQAQFKQVKITGGSRETELSIALNPENLSEVIAGCSSGLYYSSDSGASWRKTELSCRRSKDYGNPFVVWNNDKNMAFSYIKNQDTAIFESVFCRDFVASPGKTILRRSLFMDNKIKVLHATWTEMGVKNKIRKKDSSFVYYSQLRENTKTWSSPIRISSIAGDASNNDSTLMGAVCAIGPNSEIYTAWAAPQGIMFRNLSVASRQNLLPEKVVVSMKNGWQYTVGKNSKTNGLPSIVCDLSSGERRDRIYICWSDEKHGSHNKNVFLIFSDDQGETWAEPVVVTYRPNHKEQFMPCMTIDQNNGDIYILYYDQQNFVEGELTDLYLAQSKNGGLKFDYYRINTNAFKPFFNSPANNYLGLSVVNKQIRPIWAQLDEQNKPSVYTAVIDEKSLAMYDKNYSEDLEIQKTFSWSDNIDINFNLKQDAVVSAAITKPLEAGFEKIVIKNKKLLQGKNSIVIDTKKLGLQKGNYTLTLYCNHSNTFVWIIEE